MEKDTSIGIGRKRWWKKWIFEMLPWIVYKNWGTEIWKIRWNRIHEEEVLWDIIRKLSS